MLELVRELARDEIDVEAINRLVTWERLRSADATARCCPSEQISETKLYFRPSDDVVPLWKTLVIPRLGRHGGPLFDGPRFVSPDRALLFLEKD